MPATRRTFLGGLAGTSLPPAVLATSNDKTPPTRDELDRYYSFLWLEFIALSKEMDVEMHNHSVMYRSGGREAYQRAVALEPPSMRAKAVLRIVDA